jgi:hypothetical protein
MIKKDDWIPAYWVPVYNLQGFGLAGEKGKNDV